MERHPGACGAVVELNAGKECICVVPPLKDPDGLSLAAVLSHSKHMAVGSLSKPLSSICIIWGFCLHLFFSPLTKRARFASLSPLL